MNSQWLVIVIAAVLMSVSSAFAQSVSEKQNGPNRLYFPMLVCFSDQGPEDKPHRIRIFSIIDKDTKTMNTGMLLASELDPDTTDGIDKLVIGISGILEWSSTSEKEEPLFTGQVAEIFFKIVGNNILFAPSTAELRKANEEDVYRFECSPTPIR